MRDENLGMHAATREELAALGGELRGEMAAMRTASAAMQVVTRREFHIVGEALTSKIELVAEGRRREREARPRGGRHPS